MRCSPGSVEATSAAPSLAPNFDRRHVNSELDTCAVVGTVAVADKSKDHDRDALVLRKRLRTLGHHLGELLAATLDVEQREF